MTKKVEESSWVKEVPTEVGFYVVEYVEEWTRELIEYKLVMVLTYNEKPLYLVNANPRREINPDERVYHRWKDINSSFQGQIPTLKRRK